MTTNSTKRIALVTGANKSIGYEVARQLARAGLHVFIGARDPQRGQEAVEKLRAESLTVEYLQLDLEREETFLAAVSKIESACGRLDVLVNNAGIVDSADGPPSKASIASVRRIFDTNFFGTLALTQAMLPLIRKSTSGRIVNVSSGLGSIAINSDPSSPYYDVRIIGYNSSKAALNMMTAQLAAELRSTGIKVNSADPGYTATDLNGHSGPQTIEQGAAEAVRLALLPDDGPTGTFSATEGQVAW